jgi:hypothetical protein
LHSETRRVTPRELPVKRALLALLIALAPACSSEDLAVPAPEVRHAGAFFAVGAGELQLFRTLKALRIEGDAILFTTLYDVTPADFDEARTIAKQALIPIRQELVTVSEVLLLRQNPQVVWFRTLTKAEEDRSP